MPEHNFGGDWTTEKLERVRKYLKAYTTIFAKQSWAQTIYVDAFAGTGYRSNSSGTTPSSSWFPEWAETDTDKFLKGSASIALEVEPPFKQYLFIEQDAVHALELEKLKTQFKDRAASITVVQEEANGYLQHWCAKTDWHFSRAVMFLDPYGMEVQWSLIEAIAKTEAIDLWILFPLGMGVNRLLTRYEPPPEKWSNRLTCFFGTEEWKDVFYTQKKLKNTLFDMEEVQVKDADFSKIERFFVERLETIFAGVAKNPLVLRNSKNSPLYLLCFATGNQRSEKTAIKIAQDILSTSK